MGFPHAARNLLEKAAGTLNEAGLEYEYRNTMLMMRIPCLVLGDDSVVDDISAKNISFYTKVKDMNGLAANCGMWCYSLIRRGNFNKVRELCRLYLDLEILPDGSKSKSMFTSTYQSAEVWVNVGLRYQSLDDLRHFVDQSVLEPSRFGYGDQIHYFTHLGNAFFEAGFESEALRYYDRWYAIEYIDGNIQAYTAYAIYYYGLCVVQKLAYGEPLEREARGQLRARLRRLCKLGKRRASAYTGYGSLNLILQAAVAGYQGQNSKADWLFAEAVRLAKKLGYDGYLIIAYRAWADYLSGRGDSWCADIARCGIAVARKNGLHGIAESMRRRYQQILLKDEGGLSAFDEAGAAKRGLADEAVSAEGEEDSSSSSRLAELEAERILSTMLKLNSIREVDRLLEEIMRSVIELSGADSGYLFTLEGDEYRLATSVGVGPEGERSGARPEEVPYVSRTVLNRAVTTGRLVITSDAAASTEFGQDEVIRKGHIHSLFSIPLKYQNETLAVLYVFNRSLGKLFDERFRRQIFEAFASASVLAMRNADLVRNLEGTLAVFRRFVPDQVQSRIAREGIQRIEAVHAEESMATVLMSDVRDFTTLAEALNPIETLQFLNALMTPMVPIIQSYGGFVHQFIGDAIMAVFYEGEGVGATNAIQAAIEMHLALHQHNETRQLKGSLGVRMGIGLHTGRVITGTIGDQNRMEAAIIGDTVNLASRLEGLNKRYGVNLLASEATMAALRKSDAFHSRQIDRVRVKGKTQAVEVYEIFDADPEDLRAQKSRKLRDYHEGIRLFRERRWEQAGEYFRAFQVYCRADLVVQSYLERCDTFRNEPPPLDWDGAITMTEK